MTNSRRNSLGERNIEQAKTALKRGSYLLKYGRRGKPQFCPFQLSNDETTLIWYVGKEEKRLLLADVSRIIPGQRTEVFQRFPRPEKEYQSFSLIYGKRSLDLICKDKDEAEIWLVALQALISQGNCQKWRSEIDGSNNTSYAASPRNSPSKKSSSSGDKSLEVFQQGSGHTKTSPHSSKVPPQKRLGRAISDLLLYSSAEFSPRRESTSLYLYKYKNDANAPSSANTSRVSSSSVHSSSSQTSPLEDLDNLGDVFVWGEGAGDGLLGGGQHKNGDLSGARVDAFLPKAMESTQLIDAQGIACGSTHAIVVTKQGDVFSWGSGSGGRLGHGVEADAHKPKIVDKLSGLSIESVACGEYHTSALTASGELYTWGGGTYNLGLLGHGNEVSCWTPKKVTGQIGGLHISSVSCGPWHSAAITSSGQLFTFGDGSFGALGHGDRSSTSCPREVETLKGFQTLMVSCGFWHTAAVVDTSGWFIEGKLFTWGNGDDGQLGHGDKTSRLIPSCINSLEKASFCKVACGHSLTVALTTSGGVYTMGRAEYGQLGIPGNNGKSPTCVQGKLKNIFIEEIACGSSHVAALSSASEVYTWGKGKNGQLGHGDISDRDSPTLVEALKNKKVKAVVCGSNCTIAICLYKRSSLTDRSVCSGCFRPFTVTRKRHNCYHCGLSFCRGCCSKKSLKASLAPDGNKSFHVCDSCYSKINKGSDSCLSSLPPNPKASNGSRERIIPEAKARESFETTRSFLSKLASFDSSSKGFNRQESKKMERRYSIAGTFPPSYSETSQFDRLSRSGSSKSVLDSSDKVSVSLPGSAVHSQPVSPVSERSSQSSLPLVEHSPSSSSFPEATDDNLKQENDILKNEVTFLRERVDFLSRRSLFLASELERTSSKIQDAAQLAKSEADKNIAAKEVITFLVNQLKDMAARVPPPAASSCNMTSSDSFMENNFSSVSISH